MDKTAIFTHDAPQPIGVYSQAIKVGNVVYLSGQIGIDPKTNQLLVGLNEQVNQIFRNLSAVVLAAGGDLLDIVKLNVYVRDMGYFELINQVMGNYFTPPYPARAVIGVSGLPRDALVEIDGIMVLE